MENTEHYFDWAATSPVDIDILTESLNISFQNWGNPSSTHKIGKDAKDILEESRNLIAKTLNVNSNNIFFTSGGTESDQIPLLSLLSKPAKGTILISSIEHPAVREQALALKNCGWKVEIIPCNENGIITVNSVLSKITEDTMAIFVMAVNNETGAIQPIYQIADEICKISKGKRKPKFHVDCVQAAGKIDLDLSHTGIDSASFSSHKICGPRGIGVLYLKNPSIEVFLKGGGQEKGIRSGTENVFGAVAFSKCLERYYNKQNENQTKITNEFIENLCTIKGCKIIPENRIKNPNDYSPYVLQVAFEKIPGNVMVRALDEKGFYISTGSACSSKKNNRPILQAMNVLKKLQENAVRFSFGPHTTKKSVDELFNAVKQICEKFK